MNSLLDRPKSLGERDEQAARNAGLRVRHIAPLTEFVHLLRKERASDTSVPYFDPLDGGIRARCLFLLEAPGGRAVGSGFVSRNNPDETAKNFFELNQQARLAREQAITWNVVPWYVGSGTRIRTVNRRDIAEAAPYLQYLLQLLPRLRVAVLVGRKAQRVRIVLERIRPECEILECPSEPAGAQWARSSQTGNPEVLASCCAPNRVGLTSARVTDSSSGRLVRLQRHSALALSTCATSGRGG